MPSAKYAEMGGYPRIVTTDDVHERTMSWYNNLHYERYRKFSIIINKHDGLCTLFVENIRGEVINQQAFHVSPVRGQWGEEENSPFVPNDDARTIEVGMAYAFKPMLLRLGMKLTPDTFFHEIRKVENTEECLLINVKDNNKQQL